MHQDNRQENSIFIKDIRPGLKNINVMFIVLEVGPLTVTKENREIRTFKVGDYTACINVSIWDDGINSPGKCLVPGDIVKLTKGYAAIWRNCLTLYSGKNGEIVKIGDFSMVFNEQLNMSEPNPNLAPNSPLLLNNGNLNNGSPTTPPTEPTGTSTKRFPAEQVNKQIHPKSSSQRSSRAKQNANHKTERR